MTRKVPESSVICKGCLSGFVRRKAIQAAIPALSGMSKEKIPHESGRVSGLSALASAGYGQGDFGNSIYYDDNGDQKKAYSLTISFPYSDKAYIQGFPITESGMSADRYAQDIRAYWRRTRSDTL